MRVALGPRDVRNLSLMHSVPTLVKVLIQVLAASAFLPFENVYNPGKKKKRGA